MMVALPVRFEFPGEWQLVPDVNLTSSQSSELKRIIMVCIYAIRLITETVLGYSDSAG